MATSTEKTTAERLIPYIGAFLVYLMPFFIRANYPLAIAKHFSLIQEIPESEGVKSFISAILVGIPYFALVYLWYENFRPLIDRLSVKARIRDFCNDISAIINYDAANEHYKILKRSAAGEDIQDLAGTSGNLLIDFLLADLRIAVTKLYRHDGIRVAIYMEGKVEDDKNNVVQRDVLVRKYNNEHEKISDPGSIFPIGRGYCGVAWATKKPTSGTFYHFPAFLNIKDNVFYPGAPSDEKRSFLCLPIIRNINNQQYMVAVLCIDSIRKYDFLISSKLRAELDFHLGVIRQRLKEYIDLLPLENVDKSVQNL